MDTYSIYKYRSSIEVMNQPTRVRWKKIYTHASFIHDWTAEVMQAMTLDNV